MKQAWFISHASADRGLADQVLVLLKGAFPDVEIFYTSSPAHGIGTGQEVDNDIMGKIRSAQCFLAVITPAFNNSHYCHNEVGASFYDNGKHTIPLLGPGQDPTQLKGMLRNRQARKLGEAGEIDRLISDLEVKHNVTRSTDWTFRRNEFLDSLSKLAAPSSDIGIEISHKVSVRSGGRHEYVLYATLSNQGSSDISTWRVEADVPNTVNPGSYGDATVYNQDSHFRSLCATSVAAQQGVRQRKPRDHVIYAQRQLKLVMCQYEVTQAIYDVLHRQPPPGELVTVRVFVDGQRTVVTKPIFELQEF